LLDDFWRNVRHLTESDHGRKAVVEISRPGEYFAQAMDIARRADAGKEVPEADYHLGFATAAQLFKELTPARLTTLEALKQQGPQSISTLAKHLRRNYHTVQRDVAKLLEHGLVEKDAEGQVLVPWEAVEIHLTLGRQEAA
jgi:predicted transcriptional regulator